MKANNGLQVEGEVQISRVREASAALSFLTLENGYIKKAPAGSFLPSMVNQQGKYLTNDGTGASWAAIPAGYTDAQARTAIGSILSSEFVYNSLTPSISVNNIDWSKIINAPSFAPSSHTHAVSDVVNLQTLLDGKAALVHTHDWTDILNKPTVFTPSAHTHPVSDIINLQTLLDNKAALSHTHAWSEITSKPTEFVPSAGSGNYIQNQSASAQTASAWINGTLRTDGILRGGTNTQTPILRYPSGLVGNLVIATINNAPSYVEFKDISGNNLSGGDQVLLFNNNTIGNIGSGSTLRFMTAKPTINQSVAGGTVIGYHFAPVNTSTLSEVFAFYAESGRSYFADNVGIGTTTPNNKIQVVDLINFNNTDFNTNLGYQAGKNLVTGAQYNTFVGYQSGLSATTGGTTNATFNTAIGASTLKANTTGQRNTAIGYGTLNVNTAGNTNTAVGVVALLSNTTGSRNVALGDSALRLNVTGSNNTALGTEALYSNTVSGNTAVGYQVLYNTTTGTGNVGVGEQALILNTTGSYNTGVGLHALYSNTGTGGYNTGVGYQALVYNTTGIKNIAIGYDAGRWFGTGSTIGTDDNTTPTNSTYLGYDTRAGASGNTNEIVIGSTAIGNGSNTVTLGNSSIIGTYLRGNVLIGTTTSIPSAKLVVESTTQGYLKPRMTTTNRDAIASPVDGLEIYNTTTKTTDYHNGTAWVSGSYIYNQNAVAQTANAWINGSIRVADSAIIAHPNFAGGGLSINKSYNGKIGIDIANRDATNGISAITFSDGTTNTMLSSIECRRSTKILTITGGDNNSGATDLRLAPSWSGGISMYSNYQAGEIATFNALTKETKFFGITTINGTFTIASGGSHYKPLDISPVYNQTGTATGNVYGIYYNPTLTSVLGTHYFLHANTGSNVLNGTSGNTVLGNINLSGNAMLTIDPYSVGGGYLMAVTGVNNKRGFLSMDMNNWSPEGPSIIHVAGTNSYIGSTGKSLFNIDIIQDNTAYSVVGYKSKIYRTAGTVATNTATGYKADVDGYNGNTYAFYADAKTSAASPAGTAYAFYGATGKNYFADNVLIGTTTSIPSAKLVVTSTTQGFLKPRLTTTERDAIVSPVDGLEIYNTTTKVTNFHNGTSWTYLIDSGSTQSITGLKTFTNTATFNNSLFALGGFYTSSTAVNSNFTSQGTSVANETNAAWQFEGSTNIQYRVGMRGSTSPVLGTSPYAAFIMARMSVTEAAGAVTNPLIAGMVLLAPTIVEGVGTTTNAATLYVEGAPTGITPTVGAYAIWSKAGLNRFGGNVLADADIELSDSTKGIILKSPGGTRYRVTVNDSGILTTTAI